MPASARTRSLKPDARAHKNVLDWFAANSRSFPWRRTRDPYQTMVAEVMLQQTQTGRVAPIYEQFLLRFPSVERLAHAPAMEVIQAWRGLGYNRRAVDLHRAAQMIVADHGGVFPSDPVALRRLPGLGEYTTAALACFAFDAQVPVVDTNVARVLSRSVAGKDAAQMEPAKVRALAANGLPGGRAYEWNQALMDIGAMLCRVQKPLCGPCPLNRDCAFKARGLHLRRHAAKKKDEPFQGSRRQVRGGIVEHLRTAARRGLTLSALAQKIHPERRDRDLGWLAELLVQLESEGLAELSPSARRGSTRGIVRLPR